MKRSVLAYVCLSYLTGIFGCSETECADGQRKVGTVCVKITKADAGSATPSDPEDDDEETGNTSSHDAASSSQRADAAVDDQGHANVRDDAGPKETGEGSVDAAAALPAQDAAAKPLMPQQPSEPISMNPVCMPSAEQCDGVDNNCDGQIDTGATCPAPASECQQAGCTSGSCVTTPKPAGTPCAKGICDSAGTCTFCGDGLVNGAEQCDPKVPGVGTFLCSPDCKTRRAYTRCIQNKADPLGANPNCDKGYVCGAEGFCGFLPPSGMVSECPALEGNFKQFVALGCLIACSSAPDCPSILPKCLPLSVPSTAATAYCVPASFSP